MEDNEILALFFARREEALCETQQKYGQRMFISAMNILNNIQDAEECVNDALAKAWEAIPPNSPAMLGAFLSKITRNLSINKWKSKRAVRRGGGETDLLLNELDDCIPSNKNILGPEKEYESHLVTEAINNCLNSMDQTTRIIFVLRYFHGESIRNICERFNMSESKAKSLLFRSRKKLKDYLEKEGVAL